MTTPLDLQPIKDREARATKGEWEIAGCDGDRTGVNGPTTYNYDDSIGWYPLSQGCFGTNDAAFIAHARTDIPLLVAEVERLRAEAEAEERSHGQTIDDRDALHERIDEIADALGDETEWSNVNDRGANALKLAQEALGNIVDMHLAVDPVRSWFDGDGEIDTPSDVEIVEMAVEELQKDREEVQRLRTAIHQILSATCEPVVKKFAEDALKQP